jgi:GT2 family glycosyltransferase
MMLRAGLLEKYGLLDEDFFSYHEDLEYSLRLKTLGYRVVINSHAIFYHQYNFSRNKNKFYLMERNRYGLMLLFFKWPTLLLLLPMALVVEIGLLLFSLKNGWIIEKLKAYGHWLKFYNWKKWLSKRKKIQSLRTISDAKILKCVVSEIEFEGANSLVLRYFGNPVMNGYWWLVKKLIIW